MIDQLIKELSALPLEEKIEAINKIKIALHAVSPFKNEPVDCVIWVRSDKVQANSYNPNRVAPLEMRLLKISIEADGYTQPVVTWVENDVREVIDGYHRNRVAKEFPEITSRIHGYLPVVTANENRTDKGDRIASTIRHNRARGKHQIDSMSEIVLELKARNWTNERISRELGMEEDEILRLCQITGIANLFSDAEFSKSWDLEDSIADGNFEELSDDFGEDVKEQFGFRTVNTSDDKRVFHTYDKWECYKAGFYNSGMPGMTKEQAEEKFREFISDDDKFSNALDHVINEWNNSCEHYLTNVSMNRIAWLGQAALCYATGIPSTFRGGYHLLTDEQQQRADEIALEYLNKWLTKRGEPSVELSYARTERQSTIY